MNWRKHNVKETDCNTDECPPGKSLFTLFVFVINVYLYQNDNFCRLHFYIFVSVMCTCSTPRNGTGYRHNKMVCSDRSIAYCNVNEECYASEPFAYGELYNGCSSNPPPPGNYFVLESPILKLLICCHLYLLYVL